MTTGTVQKQPKTAVFHSDIVAEIQDEFCVLRKGLCLMSFSFYLYQDSANIYSNHLAFGKSELILVKIKNIYMITQQTSN